MKSTSVFVSGTTFLVVAMLGLGGRAIAQSGVVGMPMGRQANAQAEPQQKSQAECSARCGTHS